jgi:hypothetical protein
MRQTRELERVVLTADFPKASLRAGDVGTAVHVYENGAAEVEVVLPSGYTLGLVTAEPGQFRPIGPGDVPHVRTVPV